MNTDYFQYYPAGVPREIEPVTQTIDKAIFTSAKNFPHNLAYDFLGKTETYENLVKRIRRAQTVLYNCGVRRGDVVALILPNCPQHLIAFYAALSLGATVAEHNPLAPKLQLEAQLQAHGAHVVIAWEQTIEKLTTDGMNNRTYMSVDLSRELPTKTRFLLKLPVNAARKQKEKLRGTVPTGTLSFDDALQDVVPLDHSFHDNAPQLDDIALLIHTGGTTGTPKAVMLSHRNIGSNIRQCIAWLPSLQKGKEVFPGVLPLFHAFGLTATFGIAIETAATILLQPNFDVANLLAAHKRHNMTAFPGVPPMCQRISQAAQEGRKRGKNIDLTSIKYSFIGAMAVDPHIAHMWEEETQGILQEGFGMSECSPLIAGNPMSTERRISTLGIPVSSTQVMIANPDNLDEETDGIGEILVKGPQVFSGYYNNEEETKAAFHNGWLRTGDLGYWDDNFLVMADRAKEMIINGGFNIYPTQVEEAIRPMDGIKDVCVIGITAGINGESVVASVICEENTHVTLGDIRTYLEDRLPHYAMPTSIMYLEGDFPRSQVGKVLRRSVKELLIYDYELKNNVWQRKDAILPLDVAEQINKIKNSLLEQTGATYDQINKWIQDKGYTPEKIDEWRKNHNIDTENISDFLQKFHITTEDFDAWRKNTVSSLQEGAENLMNTPIGEKIKTNLHALSKNNENTDKQQEPLSDDDTSLHDTAEEKE